MSTQQITPLSLYRAFLRVQHQWPAQEARATQLRPHILTRLREEFRAPCEPAEVPQRLATGQRELVALRRMVEGELDKEYPLPESSQLRAFLPPRKQYTLLDTAAQTATSEKNATNFDYLKAYLAGVFRSRE
ncbi:hypothetical protein HDV00_005398 [Rhizophlyctis rosea]|nr:hypothetical protein HDV00_005398 [Rhizophlyctis rosea]